MKFEKSQTAIDHLTPRATPNYPGGGHRKALHGRVQRQQGAWHLRRHSVGRATVRFDGQVRFGYWLAQLHQADRFGKRERGAGQRTRHGPDGGQVSTRRQSSRPCVPRWSFRPRRSAVLHQLSVPSLHPARRDGVRGIR